SAAGYLRDPSRPCGLRPMLRARAWLSYSQSMIRRQPVSATADHAEERTNPAARLGFQPGQVVQEIGYDDDVDQELREAIEGVIETDLVDEDYDDVADAVVLWFRDDDGDLTDALVDAGTYIEEGGAILLLTPKTGRDGYVEPSDISEAATRPRRRPSPSGGPAATSSPDGLTWSARPSACRTPCVGWTGQRRTAPAEGTRATMAIKAGDKAPDFELKDNHGRTVRLSDF